MRARTKAARASPRNCSIYPVTDYHEPGTPSYAENAEGFGLTRLQMQWFWDHDLSDASHAAHPHASPLRAESLRDLPPALVYSAQYDVLRDEAELMPIASARPACRSR